MPKRLLVVAGGVLIAFGCLVTAGAVGEGDCEDARFLAGDFSKPISNRTLALKGAAGVASLLLGVFLVRRASR